MEDGIAIFSDLDPKSYTADIDLGGLSEVYSITKSDKGPKEVSAGGSAEFRFEVERMPMLKIKVVERAEHSKVFDNATVKIESGPELTGESKTTSPIADFGRTKSGDYTVNVTLKEADKKNFFSPDSAVPIKLNAGDEEPKLIEIDPENDLYKNWYLAMKMNLQYEYLKYGSILGLIIVLGDIISDLAFGYNFDNWIVLFGWILMLICWLGPQAYKYLKKKGYLK